MARPPAISANALRVRFDEFQLDEANACLMRADRRLAVAPTPFKLLCTLVRQPGVLLTKHALLDAVWGHQFVSDSVLKSAVSDLRTAMGDDPRRPRIIETVSRRGYRFLASPTAAQAPPKPMDVPAEEAAPLIGRSDALARLGRAWQGACQGKRTLVWISGEPGIGKTTLVEKFVAGLGEVACARGHGVQHHGAGEPFHPVLEALADLCRRDSEVPALLRAVAPTWLVRMPWLNTAQERDALGRELAGLGPDRMLREMGELLDCYSDRRPLLLITEDLHWSDGATVDLLNYLARRRGGARFMWLASFRLADVVANDRPLNRFRHELRAHGLCEEIVLDAFSEGEVAQFVARASPALAVDAQFVRALHERSDGGVPLLVASLLDDVLARGRATAGSATARVQLDALEVPEEVAAFIAHYLGRLAVRRAQGPRPGPPAGSGSVPGWPAR